MRRPEVDKENLDTVRCESGRRHELDWLDEAPGVAGSRRSTESTCSANHDTGTIASPKYILPLGRCDADIFFFYVATLNVNDIWQNLLNVAVQHTI